ncbi:SOSS complex subunit B1 [Striga asiatica]|uniref:SOSS complex subunit B1 n=1 Tax=Striga asiatica TaxID=4170 RepID=A0A5A7RAU1_STRAF|nr:SOSS complex subunit B1 [Striga asiatica]
MATPTPPNQMALATPTPTAPNENKTISHAVCCVIILAGVLIFFVIFTVGLIAENKEKHDLPTFKIESVSLSTTNNKTNNINTAVWDLGFSVEKLHGAKIEDFTVWARCKPWLEWSGRFTGPLYMEDKDSGLGNVSLATVLTPQQAESRVLECGVMFMGTHLGYLLFTALCNNVNIQAETAGRWIMVGDDSRLCPAQLK